jgi:pimeloyl-ACP methyl ester carboxylesterase
LARWIDGVCRTNGLDVHYLRTGGTGLAVVLLHGLTGNAATWTPVARALEGEYDVVMPDARGHGDSSAPPDGYRYDDLASDVVGLLGELGLARPALVGHSMGGMTAAVVASRWPELIRALVLVDPTFLSADRQREVHASDVAERHRMALAHSASELVAELRARHPHRPAGFAALQAAPRLETRVEAFDILRPPNPDYREVVRAIGVPTLLVVGDRPVVTLDVATELRALNPRLQVRQISDAGHGLPFDQPERLAETVASFVRGLA